MTSAPPPAYGMGPPAMQPQHHYQPPMTQQPLIIQQPVMMQPQQQQPMQPMTISQGGNNVNTNQNTNVQVNIAKQDEDDNQTATRRRPWTQDLCGFAGDFKICACGLLCPMCLMCQITGRMRENVCVPCCPGGTLALRTQLRADHDIKGSILLDCCALYWCYPCAICQMAREIEESDVYKF